jgi:hypothetical protein
MAYGTNAPFGLQPRYMSTGATWNGQTNDYLLLSGYANNLFTGDPVIQLDTGGIGIGVAGSRILGIFMGCKYVDSSGNYVFSPSWTSGTVTQNTLPAVAFVADDPGLICDVQVTSSDLNAHAAYVATGDLNMNANFVIGAGSTVSGQSGASLDAATIATNADRNLKILKVTPRPGNTLGLTYNNVMVALNNHVLKGGTGTAGV